MFTDQRHIEVQIVWAVSQDIVAAYRNTDRKAGKAVLTNTIATISKNVPTDLGD